MMRSASAPLAVIIILHKTAPSGRHREATETGAKLRDERQIHEQQQWVTTKRMLAYAKLASVDSSSSEAQSFSRLPYSE